MLSAADFILVQVFLVAGVYITRKINEISTLECVKKNQKKNLWSAIVAFEISAIVGLAFDITVRVCKLKLRETISKESIPTFCFCFHQWEPRSWGAAVSLPTLS